MPLSLKKILLVDDETGFLDVMGRRLKRRGVDVSMASSGDEAVALVEQGFFDAAVTDLKMPGMDGLALLALLRQRAPDLPVFMLTGHGGEDEAREAVERGAAGYLHKPCELDDLMACIGDCLNKKMEK